MALYAQQDVNQKEETTGGTALMQACYHGNMDLIKLLVEENEADLDIQDKKGNTALMIALQENFIKIVGYLADKGANLDLKDQFGSTALVTACYRNKKDMVMLLAEKGADLLIEDDSGRTALYYAEDKGFKDMMINHAHLRTVSAQLEKALAEKYPQENEERFYRSDPDPGIYWDDICTKRA